MGTKRITCKFCGEYMKSYDSYVSHIESSHSESIPQDMTTWRFVYYLKTGKTHGSCIICKKDTEWNEKTHKYHRFCNNPKCKEKYVETFRNRMIGKYGKVNLLNDPEQQKKMLANRKISGVYTWRDHVHETPYTGTYELSFLKFLDETLEFNPEDVIGPSPHTYYYIYEGKKHFYIPDFFIPSLNLEIEIKEGTNNHPKIQAVDKVKERLKDEVMKSNSNSFNYIKIIEKNNFRFIEFLDEAKKRFLNGDKRPIVMCESVEDNLFDELITENKIISVDDDIEILEENVVNESLEDISGIFFNKRKLLQDKYITLYHGTDLKDLKRVVPNSYNIGLKNAKPKMSSFWFNNLEYAISFATMTFIETNLNMATLLDNDMKVLVRNEYKTKIISAIRGNKSYVYEKTIESSYVGYGHEGIFPEYTLDIPVKPDHCYIINDVHMMDTIKFVSEDYIKSTIDKYKNGKMIFNSNVLQQKINKLLYYKNDNNRASKIKKAKAYKSSFDDIVAFNNMLNEYEYIIPNKGNIITRVTLESWNKYYLLTPSEFEKYHGGICWDYVAYETFYFKKYFSGVKFETYFQVVDDGKNYPSHTFLIFEYNNKYYWFESSWKPEAGIYGFNTKNDAINYAMDKLKLDDEYNRYICIYNALDKKMFGMNCDQYMNYMWDKVKPYKYSGIIKNPVISIKNKIQLPITESVDDVTNKPIIKTKNTYMIKNDKGTIISKLSYYEYKVKNFDWILMSDLDTKPDYRGKGLATKLINELYSDISKNTNKGLYLFVKSDNHVAIKLYTKLNFKKVKNYTLKDGEYIIMAKGNADMSQFDKMNFS